MRAWVEAAAEGGSEPLLVVPTVADVERFQLELARGEHSLGVTVLTFGRLFHLVARTYDVAHPPELTREQRLAVIQRAIQNSSPGGGLGRSSTGIGFGAELERLIGELQAAGVEPDAMERDAGSDPQLAGLARLYGGYCRERDALGCGDAHLTAQLAIEALAGDPTKWGRPVAFYGFDDMTPEQLELVRLLGGAIDVIAAVTYEEREALAERERLRQALIDSGAAIEATLERNPDYTESAILRRLERELFSEEASDQPPLDDGGLVLLEAAGERVQAEQIAIEIARLLREEEQSPGEVAIVLRTPERDGPLLASVLTQHGIPVALEADLALPATAVGRALIGLLRSAAGGSAEDLLAFLRSPGHLFAGEIDSFELALRKSQAGSAAVAVQLWNERQAEKPEDHRQALPDLAALGAPGPEQLAELARIARRLGERAAGRSDGARDEAIGFELRAGAAAAQILTEIGELGITGLTVSDLVATLESVSLPRLRGSTEGRVLITGPYQLRARRVPNLFVGSLQDGDWPGNDRGDPLIADSDRGRVGLPPRAGHDAEERYRFYISVSRPARRLYLCVRTAGEDGSAASPSPFLDEVARALGTEIEPAERRGLERVAPEPEEATSPHGLDRALALFRGDRDGDAPGPLTDPAVLHELGERRLFGSSTLEEWIACPYKWFVGHELEPRPLGPAPEPMAQGGLAHSVLESLFKERPEDERLPRADTLPDWLDRIRVLVDELAGGHGLDGDSAANMAARARVEAVVSGFIRRESETADERALAPALFEASFGEDAEDEKPPLALDDFAVHGKIDRVDLDPERRFGAVFDYKTSSKVSIGTHLVDEEAIAKYGKLQPGLYAIALRELWRADPIAALYYPLAATEKTQPRGIARKDEIGGLLAGLGVGGKDPLDPEAFDAALDAARAKAAAVVTEMRAGAIRREPLGGDCGYCEYAAVCRIERAARFEPEDPQREDEEEGGE